MSQDITNTLIGTVVGALIGYGVSAVQEHSKRKFAAQGEARQTAFQISSMIARIVSQFPDAIDKGRPIASIYEVPQDQGTQGNGQRVLGYLLNLAYQLESTEFNDEVKPLVLAIENWLKPDTGQLSCGTLKACKDALDRKLKSS